MKSTKKVVKKVKTVKKAPYTGGIYLRGDPRAPKYVPAWYRAEQW